MDEMQMEEQRREIRSAVFAGMDYGRETTDEEMLAHIDREITALARQKPMRLKERAKLRREVYHSIRKLDVLLILFVISLPSHNVGSMRARIFTCFSLLCP